MTIESLEITTSPHNDSAVRNNWAVTREAVNDVIIDLNSLTDFLSKSGSNLMITGIPTSNPSVAGAIWNDSGTLKVSAG